MVLTNLFESPAFAIRHDATNDWLYVEWCGQQDTVSSQASCTLIERFITATNPSKLLCDSSLALDGWDEIGQWVSNNYLPCLAETGICAIAWVTAKDWVTKAHIVEMIQQTDRPFVATFDHLASAYEWLRATSFPCHSQHKLPSPCRSRPHQLG